jgi:hypothetical protein
MYLLGVSTPMHMNPGNTPFTVSLHLIYTIQSLLGYPNSTQSTVVTAASSQFIAHHHIHALGAASSPPFPFSDLIAGFCALAAVRQQATGNWQLATGGLTLSITIEERVASERTHIKIKEREMLMLYNNVPIDSNPSYWYYDFFAAASRASWAPSTMASCSKAWILASHFSRLSQAVTGSSFTTSGSPRSTASIT